MLSRTHKMQNTNPAHYTALFAESKETLEELLVRIGAKKVISYPCTPELKPAQPVQNEPSKVVWPTLNGQ